MEKWRCIIFLTPFKNKAWQYLIRFSLFDQKSKWEQLGVRRLHYCIQVGNVYNPWKSAFKNLTNHICNLGVILRLLPRPPDSLVEPKVSRHFIVGWLIGALHYFWTTVSFYEKITLIARSAIEAIMAAQPRKTNVYPYLLWKYQ